MRLLSCRGCVCGQSFRPADSRPASVAAGAVRPVCPKIPARKMPWRQASSSPGHPSGALPTWVLPLRRRFLPLIPRTGGSCAAPSRVPQQPKGVPCYTRCTPSLHFATRNRVKQGGSFLSVAFCNIRDGRTGLTRSSWSKLKIYKINLLYHIGALARLLILQGSIPNPQAASEQTP